ncbi:MAG: alpha/beta fold hydrolase, partial [Planctomycetota bacterium]
SRPTGVIVGGGRAGGDDVRLREPLPMVLLVHGGPWARDRWGFSPLHQLLANRGYAVLSVNFRGSTGFGKRFVNLGDRAWGGAMQDDLADAVAWAVDHGIADSERVAIMGASYGGYASLMGLARDPDLFAGGVALVAPTNLVSLLESIPPYLEALSDLWRTRVGDIRSDEGRAFLATRSPLGKAESIRDPLLIAHGVRDPRVPRAESDAMVEALRAADRDVAYLLFPDEGHGLARSENRLAYYALAEAFLSNVLGGRAEPIGSALDASSVRIEMGEAWVRPSPIPVGGEAR